jgi:hypothetical protein
VIVRRTTRHSGHAIHQIKRKRLEESFGRLKFVAGSRQTRLLPLLMTNYKWIGFLQFRGIRVSPFFGSTPMLNTDHSAQTTTLS